MEIVNKFNQAVRQAIEEEVDKELDRAYQSIRRRLEESRDDLVSRVLENMEVYAKLDPFSPVTELKVTLLKGGSKA